MTSLVGLDARRVFDSRGQETVEVTVRTRSGHTGRAASPSGASTGVHEVQAFPRGGVETALATFRSDVAPKLVGMDVLDQAAIDANLHAVDGTSNFSRIGGNTATAVSVAVALASAGATDRPLWQVLRRSGVSGREYPAIVGNCLNGGRHAIGGPDIQEFHVIVEGSRPEVSIPAALAVHRGIGEALHARYPKQALGRGDEGGWVAPIGNQAAIDLLAEECTKVREATKLAVHPGLDLAASEFYRDGKYRYADRQLDAEGQLGYVAGLVDRYGMRYLEDPFQQEEFDAFAQLTAEVGRSALVVGDDLYATRVDRLRRGIEKKASTSILIKVNQVGTLTDTLATVDLAREHRLSTVSSHRSGDVPEGWLAHLAVGTGAVGLKCGLLGGERVAKLNELLRVAAATGS